VCTINTLTNAIGDRSGNCLPNIGFLMSKRKGKDEGESKVVERGKTKRAEKRRRSAIQRYKEDIELEARLRQLGLFYTHCTEEEFIIWLKHLPHTKASMVVEGDNGVRISWMVQAPSDAVFSKPGIHAAEVAAMNTDTSILISAPKSLSLDKGRIRQYFEPEDNPDWMILAFPWRLDEDLEFTF